MTKAVQKKMPNALDIQDHSLESWRRNILLIGAIVGVFTGLGAAYLLVKRAEKEETPPELTATEGVKLGVLVFGLLRQISQLGE